MKFQKRKIGRRTVLVLDEEQTRKLRAENRQDYERRKERNKNARANVFLTHF